MPNTYLKKVNECIKTNCKDINKKLNKELQKYKTKLSKKCKSKSKKGNKSKNSSKTQRNSFNCLDNFYKKPENSEYRHTFSEYEKCNKKHCSKEINELHKKKVICE